jgi:hypothetical protein
LGEGSGEVMGDNGERGVKVFDSGDFGGDGENILGEDRSAEVDGAGERLANGSSSRRSGGGGVLEVGGELRDVMLVKREGATKRSEGVLLCVEDVDEGG